MKIIRQMGSLAFVLGLFVCVFVGVPWHVVTSTDPVIPPWLQIAVFALLGGVLVVLLTLALESKRFKAAVEAAPTDAGETDVMLLNVADVPGRSVGEVLGLAQGHTVFAIWIGRDLAAIARLILGGELTEYTEMMGQARATATDRMRANAAAMGADAVVNVRYMTTSVVGTAAELMVYGTAVKFAE